MATLSVLSYNLSQGLKMKSNENTGSSSSLVSSTHNNNNNNSLAKTFNKITVQNVLSESKGNVLNICNNNGSSGNSSINNANAIVKKIKDFGMIGTVNAVNSNSSHTSSITATKIGVARKRPLSESKIGNNSLIKPGLAATTPKKPKLATKAASTPKIATSKKVCENVNQQKLLTQASTTGSSGNEVISTPTTPTLTAGTPGRKGLPAPQAVARRNARERNRVKQVNNGFAALRERIPEEVAEAFEAQGNGRATAAAKKLSKVETLRMAVEYIRSLERLLGFDFPIVANPTANDSFALIKDEFGVLSPGLDDQYNDDSLSNYELDEDFAASHSQIVNNSATQFDEQMNQTNANIIDLLPNITTFNGLQYIRIPGTSTYQLLTSDIFAGNSQSPPTSNNIANEQFHSALIDTNCQSPRSASSSVMTTADDLHGSPTATVATTTLIMQTTAAPALHQAATNGDHVRRITSSSPSSLSRSPVPQTSSSPNAATTNMLQQQRQDLTTTTATLSPVANNALLLQTCADDVVLTMANNERLHVAGSQQFVPPILTQQQQQSLLPSHKIKQEFIETDFHSDSAELSPNLSAALIYQTIMQHNQQQRNQQQQQTLLLEQTSMSMSPPLDRVNSNSAEVIITAPSALPGYFEQDHNRSFYDGIVTFKKERNDHSMLDTTGNNTTVVLSDESMMEAIDWWEAHTPKSDGGSVIM